MAEAEEFEFRLRSEQETGHAVTAPPKESAPESTLKQDVVGEVEAAGKLVTGAVAGLGGGLNYLGTLAATRDPKAAQAVKESTEETLTYQPRTRAGKEISANLERPFQKLGEKADAAGAWVADKTRPVLGEKISSGLGAATTTGIQAAPMLLPGVPKTLKAGARALEPAVEAGLSRVRPVAERIAARGEEKAAIRTAEDAPKNAKIEQARSIGLKVPPSEAGGRVGKILEGVSGKIQTEMSFSRANAKAINRTAAKEIGLSDRQPMTEANLERQKQKAYQPYQRIRKAGRLQMDDAYREQLNAVRERTQQAESDFPEDTNELIDKEIKKFDRPSADAGSMLEKIKSLRERASKNMQATDAEKFELGIAQKKIATAMEDQIERQVAATDPTLIQDFRVARQQLAKIYNVEDALGPNGNLSAAVLARQLKRGVPLSGGLRTIAETYAEFPKVMRYVDSLGGHAPFSALDYLVGGVEALAHPAGAAKIVGALAGRPIARGIIKSETYQRAAIKSREPKPSVTARTARRIAGPTLQSLEDSASGPMSLRDRPQ